MSLNPVHIFIMKDEKIMTDTDTPDNSSSIDRSWHVNLDYITYKKPIAARSKCQIS